MLYSLISDKITLSKTNMGNFYGTVSSVPCNLIITIIYKYWTGMACKLYISPMQTSMIHIKISKVNTVIPMKISKVSIVTPVTQTGDKEDTAKNSRIWYYFRLFAYKALN